MDKEKEYAETFKGLDEQFGSTFELEDNLKPQANVPAVVEEPKPFVQKQNTETELEDSVYISNELKMTVESIDTVMSKLDEDGKPILREDGTILKGPNYFKPDLNKFV